MRAALAVLILLAGLLASPTLAHAQNVPGCSDPGSPACLSGGDPVATAAPTAAPTNPPACNADPTSPLCMSQGGPATSGTNASDPVNGYIAAMKTNIETPCDVNYNSILGNLLGNLANSVDSLLSFNNLQLRVGQQSVNVAFTIFFGLFFFAMLRYYQEVQRMQTLWEMLTSFYLKIAGVAAILCLINLAGGTTPFTGTNPQDAGKDITFAAASRDAGMHFSSRLFQTPFQSYISSQTQTELTQNGISFLTAPNNQIPQNNAQMIRFGLCEAVKPLQIATIMGFLVPQDNNGAGSGNWATAWAVHAITYIGWQIIYIIVMLPSSAAILIATFIWCLHQDMLSINANLIALLGIFTLAFLATEWTRQWGTPYITLLYNIFINAMVLGAVGGLVLVFLRNNEILMVKVVHVVDANTQGSIWELALGCTIFCALAAAMSIFTPKIVQTIIQGTLSFTGADVLAGGAAAAGLAAGGVGAMGALLGGLGKAFNALRNKAAAKNSVGRGDSEKQSDSSAESASQSVTTEGQPNLSKTAAPQAPEAPEAPAPKPEEKQNQPDIQPTNATDTRVAAPQQQKDAQEQNSVGGATDNAHTGQTAGALTNLADSANAVQTAAMREADAHSRGTTATNGVSKNGLNKLRQSLGNARRTALSEGNAATAARTALAETITKHAENALGAMSPRNKAAIGAALAKLSANVANPAAFSEALGSLRDTVGTAGTEDGSHALAPLAAATQSASDLLAPANAVGGPTQSERTPFAATFPTASPTTAADGEAGAPIAAGLETVAAGLPTSAAAAGPISAAARGLGGAVRNMRRVGSATRVAAQAVGSAAKAVMSGNAGLIAVTSAAAAASVRYAAGTFAAGSPGAVVHSQIAQQLESTLAPPSADVTSPAGTIANNAAVSGVAQAVMTGSPQAPQMAAGIAQQWQTEATQAGDRAVPPGYDILAGQMAGLYQAVAGLPSLSHPSVARGLALLDATGSAVASGSLDVGGAYAALAQVRSAFTDAQTDLQNGGAMRGASACAAVAAAAPLSAPTPSTPLDQLTPADLARAASERPAPKPDGRRGNAPPPADPHVAARKRYLDVLAKGASLGAQAAKGAGVGIFLASKYISANTRGAHQHLHHDGGRGEHMRW